VASIACSLGLVLVDARWTFIVLVVLAGISYGFYWVPGTTMLSDGAERIGLDLAFAAMLLNLAWAPGNVVGAAAGGALADAAGDSFVYVVAIALCALSFLAAAPGTRRARGRPDAASRASSAPAE
jgi:MFS family permease